MRRHLTLACLALALTACQASGSARAPSPLRGKLPARPAAAAQALPAPKLWPYPLATGTSRLVDLAGQGSLSGQVRLRHLDASRYGNNRATYRLLAEAPAAQALVLVTLLDDAVVRVNGQPLEATTDATGAFALSGRMPTDRPLVVTVRLAGGLRLAALLPAGQASVVVDEASTVVLESLRLQLPQSPADPPQPGERLVGDLGASEVAALAEASEPFLASLSPSALAEAFLGGAGEALRSAAVGFLGAGVRSGGNAAADRWSDAWTAVLGHRPLALTRVAGNGRRGVANDRGDAPATASELVAPAGVAEWGGMRFVAEEDGHRLSLLPSEAMAGWGALAGRTLQPGGAYALLGPRASESGDQVAFDDEVLGRIEPGPDGSVPMVDAAEMPLLTPFGVAVRASGGALPHVAVSSRLGQRIAILPGAAGAAFGATLDPAFVALVAGRGLDSATGYGEELFEPEYGATQARYSVGDAGPGHQASLSEPAALAFDAAGNLWLHDAGEVIQYTLTEEQDPNALQEEVAEGVVANFYHSQLRVLRASDGHLFTQALTHEGQPLRFVKPVGLAVHDGHAYVADPNHHWVFRFALPAGAAVDAWATNPAPVAVQPVLGAFDDPGVLDLTQLPGGELPAYQDLWDPLPQAAARLQLPSALALSPDGRLWVGDAGRVWSLSPDGLDGAGGQLRLVAGGLDRDGVEGDAHLAWFPGTQGMAWGPAGLLISDRSLLGLRLLHAARGLD